MTPDNWKRHDAAAMAEVRTHQSRVMLVHAVLATSAILAAATAALALIS